MSGLEHLERTVIEVARAASGPAPTGRSLRSCSVAKAPREANADALQVYELSAAQTS